MTHRLMARPTALHLHQDPLFRRRRLRIQAYNVRLVVCRFCHCRYQVPNKGTRCPADHVIIFRLDLYRQPGYGVGQLQRHKESLPCRKSVDPELRFLVYVAPTVQEEWGKAST